MIDSESLVRDLVETFNLSGFVHDNIPQRDVFLSYLVICFVNHLEYGYYAPLLEQLSDVADNSDVDQLLDAGFEYKKPSHSFHFTEFFTAIINLNNVEKITQMAEKMAFLNEPGTLLNSAANELTVIYDHVLQRLQTMNAEDRLEKNFNYQEPPFDFSELIALLANRRFSHRAYDPYATTGESSVSYALHSINASITTESVMQTAKYINHKLVIAGVSEIDTKHSYALSPRANVEPESFDVAFTLFQPTETSELAEYEEKKRLNKTFTDNRIVAGTIFDKYREHGFIQHIIWSLKQDGIGFVILGKGPLHRQFESEARNLLLQGNFVDAVIQLPPKLITSRTVPLYILVMRKNRGDNTKIKFIDASSFCTFDGRCNQLTNIEKLARLYHMDNVDSGMTSLVDMHDIDPNSALLTVSSYVKSVDDHHEEIDSDLIRQELARQQKMTDLLIAKINGKPAVKN